MDPCVATERGIPAGVEAELEVIRHRKGGVLRAVDVVEWARIHTGSSLHAAFEWRDNVAAEAHRLEQARRLIRVVVVSRPSLREPIRAYVSLSSDRKPGGGVYRAMVDVLASDRMFCRHVEDVQVEVRALRRKLARLVELGRERGLSSMAPLEVALAEVESRLVEVVSEVGEIEF